VLAVDIESPPACQRRCLGVIRRIAVAVEPVVGTLVPVGVRVRLAGEAAAYPFVQVERHDVAGGAAADWLFARLH
jgi:hypothetical protein